MRPAVNAANAQLLGQLTQAGDGKQVFGLLRQQPEAVDRAALLAVFPYGKPTITVVKGGLDVPRRDKDGLSVIANAAVVVSFDMERTHA